MFKNSFFKPFALLLGVLLVTTGCSAANNTGNNTSSLEPVVENGILFSDDFSDPGSGWGYAFDAEGSTDYVDGTYQIDVRDSSQILWVNPGQFFGDVRVEVDATLVAGEMDNSFGIICRHWDVDNFYALLVSSDGYYAIYKRYAGGDLEIISGTEGIHEFSDAIPQGNTTVHLAAECVSNSLRLYINDTLLTEAFDIDIAEGDVGLTAWTFDTYYTTIEFDNFVVLKP